MLIDTLVHRPLLQLDNNDLPHIVYYTYSGDESENSLIQHMVYATYQEIEMGGGYNWHKSTIAQRNMSGCDECLLNDIAGFELDSNNQPHIVYHNWIKHGGEPGEEEGSQEPIWYESTLHYAVSDDWISWDTIIIHRGENNSIMIDVSMTLDHHDQVHMFALMLSTDDDYWLEPIYLRFNGEDIIQSISIGFANYADNFARDYHLRTSLSIAVDSEDIIHMGYIDSMNRYTYATLEFYDSLQYSTTTSTIDVSVEPNKNEHSYYDLTLIVGPDGTPHTLYTSFEYGPQGEFPPDGWEGENLGGDFLIFYSVFEDGEWNRHQIGVGYMNLLPGLTVDNDGRPTIIHNTHNFVNRSGLSLMSFRPIDSDDDGDGCLNFEDQFPTDASEQFDSDGDGVGDNADVFPEDPTETHDTDGDGFGDEVDAFPTRITQWTDYDGDGYGDNFANSSWDVALARPGEYVQLAFKQDACPLLAGTSYLGTLSNGEGIVVYGCPDSDGDGYADIIETNELAADEPEEGDGEGGGSSGVNLDLIGIILSLILPTIAIFLGWYYSTRKRRNLESLIQIMGTMDNPLDLTTWFDLTSTDAILDGEINHAQLELLRTHYRRHHDRLTSIHNTTESTLPENR